MDRERGLNGTHRSNRRWLWLVALTACLLLLMANVATWRSVRAGWKAAASSNASVEQATLLETRRAAVAAAMTDRATLGERPGSNWSWYESASTSELWRAITSARRYEPGTLSDEAKARTGASRTDRLNAEAQAASAHQFGSRSPLVAPPLASVFGSSSSASAVSESGRASISLTAGSVWTVADGVAPSVALLEAARVLEALAAAFGLTRPSRFDLSSTIAAAMSSGDLDRVGLEQMASGSHEVGWPAGLVASIGASIASSVLNPTGLVDRASIRADGSQASGIALTDFQGAGFSQASNAALADPAVASTRATRLDGSYILHWIAAQLGFVPSESGLIASSVTTGQASVSAPVVYDRTGSSIGHGSSNEARLEQVTRSATAGGISELPELRLLVQQLFPRLHAVALGNFIASGFELASVPALLTPARGGVNAREVDRPSVSEKSLIATNQAARERLGVTQGRSTGVGSRALHVFHLGEQAAARVVRGVAVVSAEHPSYQRGHVAAIAADVGSAARGRAREGLSLRASTTARGGRVVTESVKMTAITGAASARARFERASMSVRVTGTLHPKVETSTDMSESVEFRIARASQAAHEAPSETNARVASEEPAGATELVVVPRRPEAGHTLSEVVAVLLPGRPMTVQIPDYGVTLRIPSVDRSDVFQARLAIEPTDSVDPPDGFAALRVVRVEIFDALGRRSSVPVREGPVELVIRLDSGQDSAAHEQLIAPLAATGQVRLVRYEPGAEGLAWLDVPLRALDAQAVIARLDHLSLFALVQQSRPGPTMDRHWKAAFGTRDAAEVEVVTRGRSVSQISWVAVLVVGLGAVTATSILAAAVLKIGGWKRTGDA